MKFIFIATFIATIFIDLSQANTQTWELSIKGYLSGFKVGIASGEFIQKKEKIFLNINAETSGIINFFFPWKQTIVVKASMDKTSISPNFYRVDDLREKTKKGHMELIFVNNIATVNSAEPSINNDSRRKPVSRELRKDVLDPASAIIAIGYMTIISGNCNHKIPIFDGRRRFNLFTEEIGIEELTSSVFTDSSGKALKCKIKIEKVAGYSAKELKRHPKTGYIWLQKLPNTDLMMFPVKVQLPIGKGSFMAHLSINAKN